MSGTILRYHPDKSAGLSREQWAKQLAYQIVRNPGPQGVKFVHDHVRHTDGAAIFTMKTWERYLRDIKKPGYSPPLGKRDDV